MVRALKAIRAEAAGLSDMIHTSSLRTQYHNDVIMQDTVAVNQLKTIRPASIRSRRRAEERETGKANDTGGNGDGDVEDEEVHAAILYDVKALVSRPPLQTLCNRRQMREQGSSANRRGDERGALVGSPTSITPLTSERNPPPYGVQHRQDAHWEGGNEALPPRWRQYEVGGGGTHYQDNNLTMVSRSRPLPGVRLDEPGRLVVPGCEWHVSPLGRSYFVDHNTRTTSWQKPTPERPAGSLTPECVMEGHSECIWSLACVGATYNIVSASGDGSIRQWKRYGEQVEKPWRNDGGGVWVMAVSPEESMLVCGNADNRLRLWNMKKGNMVRDPWEGHNAAVRCLDWSPNAREVVSGSEDGTVRRWNPDTGRQIASPIETGHGWVNTVKYSPQGDKFASGVSDHMVCVWSKDGKLLIESKGHDDTVNSLCWSKDGAHIFSGSSDFTIRKWQSIDGKELIVLRGHTRPVRSICLSPNGRHLVSASADYSIRIWDLRTNQQVGEPLLHNDELFALAISSDGRYIASGGLDKKIYLWSIEAVLKKSGDQSVAKLEASRSSSGSLFALCLTFFYQQCATLSGDVLNISPSSKRHVRNRGSTRYSDDFWRNNTNRAPHRSVPSTDPLPRRRNLFDSLRFNLRPVDASQPLPLQPRRRNFSLFTRISSVPTVDVAPAQDVERYSIAPPTEAEVAAAMAAALPQASGNAVDGQTSQDQAAAGVRGSHVVSQGQPSQLTQGQHLSPGVEDPSYEIGCFGIYVHFGRRRST
ncbi:WD40 repeat-like protein [Rhizopogon vinicolor AM-OR11-026]|uniref:WD40 repeat-like protein n=1 Tax=Rhizopogon vinicolor AM-OR11-026 TaxID=1314800 RepID=A0A1B7MGN1_9AGAM|nr:WD40 repeat-like protein [Rhizopogon vinicolor AM-OR11-026]